MKNSTDIEFLFGGSFDPVHFGHLNVIKNLRSLCQSWRIRILPCFVPPLKNLTTAIFEQRVEMLKLATQSIDNLLIDERESQRSGKSYTLDSLKSLLKAFPTRHYVLVVGSDTLKGMRLWHQWQQLSNNCHLLVINRPGAKIENLEQLMHQLKFQSVNKIQDLEGISSGCYYSFEMEESNVSSTEIRTKLLKGLSVDKLISKDVLDYIEKKFLYQ